MTLSPDAGAEPAPTSNPSTPPAGRRRRSRRRGRGRKGRSGRPSTPASSLVSASVHQAARRLGIQRLYPEQEQAIAASLAGRDVLMILPTGFGKSACYQIPSMILDKPVLVISPLLALLRDQQEKLDSRGVPVIRLDGTVRGKARREALERVAAGGSLLLMTTPETLETDDAQTVLRASGIGLAAVDEAHCISEWGHDFRPSYSRIGLQLKKLGAPPVLGLTATATPKVRETIVDSLRMRDVEIVAASPHRSNLAFEVIPCEGDMRLRALVRLTKRLRRPGIVYCSTRREVDALYVVLRKIGMPAHRYHGKMSAGERASEQEWFMKTGRRSLMVATSAFGLGIDKRDIRYIVHYQAPASLEQYVQEAGRAGRDGARSNCILLADLDDRRIHEALLSRSRVQPQQLYKLGKALAAWSAEDRDPTLEALAVSAELGPRVTAALLTRIEEAGIVQRDDDNRIILHEPAETIEERARGLAHQFETLRTQDSRRLDSIKDYVEVGDCRAGFLRAYFGEEDAERCGICDNCRGRDGRPDGFFAPIKVSRKVKRRVRAQARAEIKERASGGRSKRKTVRSDGAAPARKTAGKAAAPAGKAADAATQGARNPRKRRRRRRPRRTPSGDS